jgi:hypothetical protein
MRNIVKRCSVKKFSIFYGTRMFVTAFFGSHCLSLSWARQIQSAAPNPPSLRSILILSSYLRLRFQRILFPSRVTTNNVHAILICPMRATRSPPQSPCFNYHINIWWRTQIMKLCTVQLSSASCSFVSLIFKYSPQHPVLRHPQFCVLSLMWETGFDIRTKQQVKLQFGGGGGWWGMCIKF